MGAASGSSFWTTGWSMSFGRSARTVLRRSRTSWAATLTSFSMTKLMMTWETPSVVTDRSSSIPLIVLTASSILSVISVSMSSGAAPGWFVMMTMMGKSTFGKRSTPSCTYPAMPMTHRTRMRTDAKIGRFTQRAASHCMAQSTRAPSRTSGPGETTTLSPGFTPSTTATRSPCDSPSWTSRSCTCAPATT